MGPKRRRCAIYLRISKDDAGTSLAPERQLATCEEEAERRGWDVVARYEDRDLSAYRRKVVRPGYDEMLNAASEGTIDAVLCWKMDRLLRRARDLEPWLDLHEDKGLLVASCNDPTDTTTATGRAVLRTVVAFAQLESEQMSLRIKAEIDQTAKEGKPRLGGRRPYGLTADWTKEVPDEAKRIRHAARRVIAGESLRSITMEWNDAGIPSSTGGKWDAAALRYVLLASRTVGMRSLRGKVVATDGKWPALLTHEQQAQVRDILEDPARKMPSRGRVWLLSGIAVCGKCGGKMRGTATTRGDLRYACVPKPRGCNSVAIVAGALEDHVIADALAALDLERLDTTPPPPTPPDEDLDERRAEVARLYGAGEISREEWLAAREALAAREVAQLPQRTPAPVNIDLALFDKLPPNKKRLVLASIVKTVTVAPVGKAGRWAHVADRVVIEWLR